MTELEKTQAELIKVLEERSAMQESRIRFLEMQLSEVMERANRVIRHMARNPPVTTGFGIYL
jgi:uncharacterized coiled-coil protein SlyX